MMLAGYAFFRCSPHYPPFKLKYGHAYVHKYPSPSPLRPSSLPVEVDQCSRIIRIASGGNHPDDGAHSVGDELQNMASFRQGLCWLDGNEDGPCTSVTDLGLRLFKNC